MCNGLMEAVKASAAELVRRNLSLEAVLAEAGLDGAVSSATYSDAIALVRAHADTLHQPAALLATQHITSLLLGAPGPKEIQAALSLASHLHGSLLLSTSHLLSLLARDVDRLSLQLLWGLHSEHLLPLQDLLSHSTAVTDHLVGSLARATGVEKTAAQGVANVLIELGIASVKQGEHSSQIARDILFRTVRATFTADRFSHPPPYTLCDVVVSSPSISRATIRAFFSHLATELSLSSPRSSVFTAMAQQQQWKFASLPPHTVALYSVIADNTDGSEAVKVVQQLSDKEELNWESLMSFIACLLNTAPGLASELQGAISSLVSCAVVECHAPSLYSGLVLARQCSFEGAHLFPSYQKWVQQMFGDSRTTVVTSKRALQFLMRCLTEAVPHEPAFSLRAHIASPPRHMAKCHSLIPDYISLAKTRLQDLKEPFTDSGSGVDGQAEQWPEAKADVQQALEHFEQSGKVHPSVLQASIFKKPYFVGRFLPTLLTPALPGGGIRDQFIQALVREKKVPQKLLTGYERACNQARLGGPPLPTRPTDPLEHAQNSTVTTLLQQLLGVIQRKEGSVRVTQLLSKLSSALERHVHHCRRDGGGEEVAVDLHSPGREQWEVELVDSLVRTVCECVLFCSNLAEDQYYWLPSMLDMLSGHRALHPALYIRLWELLHAQETQLSDSHLLVLAVLCSEMFGSTSVFSPLRLEGAQTLKSCSEYCRGVLGGLQHCTASSMQATLRFGCHFLHHSLTQRNVVNSEDEEFQIAPPILIQKVLFLYRRFSFSQQHTEIPQTRKPNNEVVEMVRAIDVLLQVPEFKSVWNKTQLPFQDWAAWELAVQDDIMPRHSRLEYLRRTLYCHYLTLPVEGGGLGGGRREAFRLLFGALVQYGRDGSSSEGLQILQEVAHCLLEYRRDRGNTEVPCLVQAMTDLTGDLGGSAGVPGLSRLHNQRTLYQESFKIACCLPPQLFFCDSPSGDPPTAGALEASAAFLEHHMAPPLATYHLILPAPLTQYLLQGLNMLDRNGGDSQAQFLELSPLYYASLIFHWPQLHCHSLSDQLHSRLEAASQWVHSSFEAISPPVVEIDPVIIGVCSFGEITRDQSRSTALLEKITSALGEASKQVLVVIFHCCVSQLTASTLHGDSTTDQKLLNLAKACLALEPSAVESLDSSGEHCITHKHLLMKARTHLTTCAITHLFPIVLFRLLSCLSPSSLSQLVQQQHSLLPLCLKAHTTCLQLNCTLTTPAQIGYQPFSIVFIRECTQLARQVIQLAPSSRLKCVEGLCHISIRPAVLSRIS